MAQRCLPRRASVRPWRRRARSDLKQPDAVEHLLADVKPDVIYHLAAQAFVPRSFEDPWETLENNIRAQLNINSRLPADCGCVRAS